MMVTLFLFPSFAGSGGQSTSMPTRQPANVTTLTRGVVGEPAVNSNRSIKPVMNSVICPGMGRKHVSRRLGATRS